jgi:hypothetical protein
MSKIKDPTILFQYKSAPKFSILLEGIKQFVIDNSKEDIFRFFNIDEAYGLWLDQLGAYLNIKRPLIPLVDNSNIFKLQNGLPFQFQNDSIFELNLPTNESAGIFISDYSLMDTKDLLGGGTAGTPAPDNVYRSYIKGQIFKRNSRFTIDDIISVLQFIIPISLIYIEEGIKCLKFYVSVPSDQDQINLELLNALDPKWFGTPTGVCIEEFKIYQLPENSTFFLSDFGLMDNEEYLLA